MPIQIRLILLGVLLSALALGIRPSAGQPPNAGTANLQAEIAVARDSLQEHPKFKKYYEHLADNPETLPLNGPKLAALLAAEAKTSAAIKDHAPSLLATWQEVMRLAAAGNDYKTAFPAIDYLRQHPSGLLTPGAARLAKGNLLAAAVSQNGVKPVPGEREAQLELLRELFKDALAANDEQTLPSLLAADTKLSWSPIESANSIQLLLPLAQQALDANRVSAAKLLFEHLDTLVPKTAFGKSRKEFADAIAAARERLTIVEGAQQAQETLASKPLDPAANHAYGMYLLTYRGQWRESLTYLALGNDPAWKKLAAESLDVKTAADKVALADRWSALVKDDNAPSKELARHFYREALADKSLVGIARAAVEEKAKLLSEVKIKPVSGGDLIAKKQLPLNEWTDLLPLVDFDQDLVLGFFAKAPRNAVQMDSTPHSRIRLPVLLTDCSYDLAVEFNAGAEGKQVHLLLPVGKQCVCLIVDGYSGNDICYFSGLQKTPSIRQNLLQPNQAYRYEVSVRLKDERVSATFTLNGKKVLEHEGLLAAVQSNKEYNVGTHAQLGLAGFRSTPVFTTCQVRPVSGSPDIGRDAPLIKPIPADVKALKATRLTTLRPIEAKAHNGYFAVSALPKGADARAPIVGGVECNDFLFTHAPSTVTYSIPAKAKYFTAVAYCALDPEVKFVVKVDGKELFATERRPIDTVIVEIPEGGKILQLECIPLGKHFYDHSSWCFPAFR